MYHGATVGIKKVMPLIISETFSTMPRSKAEKTLWLKKHRQMHLQLPLSNDTSGTRTRDLSD